MKLALRWDQNASIHVDDAYAILAARNVHLGSISDKGPVLDLGAHIGALTCLAALAGHFVVAVEADPVNARWLRKNVLEHGVAGRVVVIEAAVSTWSGHTRELRKLGGGQSSLLYAPELVDRHNPQVFKVPTVSFENLAGMFPDWDLLKCDVEGAEWEFLGPGHDGFDSERDGVRYPGSDDAVKRFQYIDLEAHMLTNRDYFNGDKGPDDVKDLRNWIDGIGFTGVQEPHPLMIRRWRSK